MAQLVKTDKEYIYLKIPTKYIVIYHKLMKLMIKYGEDMLKDCKADCKAQNVEVIKCFNMFNSMLFAKELDNIKLERVLFKYLDAKLKQLYCNKPLKNFTIILEDGKTGYVDCSKEIPEIYIDPDEHTNKGTILYGAIKPTDFENLFNYQEYANKQIILDNFISTNEIDVSNIQKVYEHELTESKLIFVTLVPETINAIVKLDDGFGEKVDFGSTGLWYSNGDVKVKINDIVYKVFGEIYTISSNVKFYISVV